MAQQNINLGADGSGAGGDTGRTAFAKAQANFTELFQRIAQLGTASNKNTGTSGDAVPLLDTPNTWGATQTCIGSLIAQQTLAFGSGGVYAPGSIFSDAGWGVILRAKQASPTIAHFRLADAGDAPLLLIDISNALKPGADNTQANGAASARWSTVYAGTGTINTSDAREKTEVRALTDGEIAAARQLAQEIGAYKFLAAVTEKGADAREHIGLTVQRAIEILQANGLEPFNYGFICYDSWPQATVDHPATYEQVPVTDSDGNVTGYENGALIKEAWTEVTQEAGDRYSFRTDELNLFIARGQAAYLAQLEARIAALESAA